MFPTEPGTQDALAPNHSGGIKGRENAVGDGTKIADMNCEWPILSFSCFALGMFVVNDFRHGFTHTIGLSLLAVAVLWAVASRGRWHFEKAEVRIQGLAP